MKLKLFTSLIFISLFLAVPNYAQEWEINLRELYNLCSKFPLNSRCRGEGRFLPILLADRPGHQAQCALFLNQARELAPCKVEIDNEGLTIYREIALESGDRNNQGGTQEIKIPFRNIFAQTAQIWEPKSRSNSLLWNELAEINVGFTLESDTSLGNRSKFLKVWSNPSFGLNLRSQLERTTNFSSKVIFQNQLATQVEMASSSDKSVQLRQLLQTKVCIRCDLRESNLQSADLEIANLEGANLEGSNLAGSKLKNAYLVAVNLNNVNLNNVNMTRAILALGSLIKANLEGAKLQGANLQSTNLEQAILRNANLNAEDNSATDLKYANLQQADLSQAKLSGANLMLANLEGANLETANLSDITTAGNPLGTGARNFQHRTNLSGANLSRANLSNANLEKAVLISANLSHASLRSTRLKNADMRNANLSGADLSNANLERANLCGATMPDGTRSNQGCK